jgi:hypothetical protein
METVEVASGVLWYTAREWATSRGSASRRTTEEKSQQNAATGFEDVLEEVQEETSCQESEGVPRSTFLLPSRTGEQEG